MNSMYSEPVYMDFTYLCFLLLLHVPPLIWKEAQGRPITYLLLISRGASVLIEVINKIRYNVNKQQHINNIQMYILKSNIYIVDNY